MASRNIRAALILMRVGNDKTQNLENAAKLIREARGKGARLVSLPECLNSPYGIEFFDEYAESIPDGPTSAMLKGAAKENGVYLIGGSFPERSGGKLYNTCTVWGPDGALLAKFRKMHLFDIDIPGGITFKESDGMSPGNSLAIFEVDGVKVGLGICHDMRFEELAKLYRLGGCEILAYPGAFDRTTGLMHWELLQRGRAVDNQVYVMTISPARGEQGYIAWGHSQVIDPWGKVIVAAGAGPEIVYADLDLRECDKVRQQIPIFHQRRTDVYDTISK